MIQVFNDIRSSKLIILMKSLLTLLNDFFELNNKLN